jgi:hypothetical protein
MHFERGAEFEIHQTKSMKHQKLFVMLRKSDCQLTLSSDTRENFLLTKRFTALFPIPKVFKRLKAGEFF